MGYRAWNNYEESAERDRRAAWSLLPWRTRLAMRLRQAAILGLIFGIPTFAVLRAYGLI